MISSEKECYGTQEFPKLFLELYYKMRVFVAYNYLGYPKYLKTLQKNSCSISSTAKIL